MMTSDIKNPSRLPITELVLEDETGEKFPALSARWIEKRCFAKYVPLKLKNGKLIENTDVENEWITQVQFFNKDLEWMLGLNFHKFWSHAMFDKDFMNSLLFFLQESTPFYIPIRNIFVDNEAAVELYERICRNALVVVCRLTTNRESELEFMPKEKQAEILYKNFIITIPMLFDMVALYGYNNKNIIQRIFEMLLKIESKYLNDLKLGIKFIQTTFNSMRKQLETVDTDNRELFESYEDLSLYLMNVAVTLNLVIELVPNEIKVYCTRELHLEQSIAYMYDNFIPALYQNTFNVDSEAWYLTYINYARVELINCFRNLINRAISSIVSASEKNRQKLSDEILSTLTECAGFKTFIMDYVQLYPIEMDLDVVLQCGRKIDTIKLKFVQEAFKAESNAHHSNIAKNGYDYFEAEKPLGDEDALEGACALPLSVPEVEEPVKNTEEIMQLETSKILELFPNYGVGYIRRLLAHYDNSSETVISKILEDTLDPTLKQCDELEPYIPPETPDKVFAISNMERSNIYDGDKFDVMSNNGFRGIIKKGGRFVNKKEPKTYNELLNDKSHILDLKDRYRVYGMVDDGGNDVEYDDEYDDSYEVFADTEPKIHLHGKMRDMLPDDIDSEQSEEEEQQSASAPTDNRQKNALDFCENPEIIRARREQHYNAKISKKFPQRQQKEPPTRDVVGAKKGQGQSNEVLRNRQLKGSNKSSRANHSRKAGSTFKQSRGMF